jgi:hypothetical protein
VVGDVVRQHLRALAERGRGQKADIDSHCCDSIRSFRG